MQNEEFYPKDFQEFLTQFKSEDDCWGYIFQMRWPDGYICSKCKSNKYWLTQEKIIHCSSCGYETAVTRGNISPKHLPYYLDEFAFRFNRKLSTYRGKLFYRLMQQAVTTPPMPLKEIVKESQLV